ncbi:uncharacterized protein LACBIDRAFT_333855 [Laccaria bicolor S238N-H82]|uniref:Predicted protein n=1 Tax=Laccaria bicolor (strain S238N-H82 / ATCC MYA-4686) TaxID=486041 RepID=B0DXA8_LACBS|nr:uncharacterized protein LACBIDRAFT_333855 [Laccaria bicolor S238N-H82]EDR00801.1 predicted protein [Laccaria bicolor S238N-H82]|eukprot:XP_001888593.1 predicted protein [Laccaria bicolor S238N-H82]
MQSCGTWRLNSTLNPHNWNLNEQANWGLLGSNGKRLTGTSNRERWIKVYHGAGIGTIDTSRYLFPIKASGIPPGEVRLSTSNWYLGQGMQRHRDNRYESAKTKFIQSSPLHRGQRNPRRDHMVSRDI